MENSPVFKEIKEDLELFDNWEDRYAYIIDLGKNIELSSDKKTDAYKKTTSRLKKNGNWRDAHQAVSMLLNE